MCTNGVNTNQLKDTITQIDEAVALCRKWTHRMYHLAEGGQMERSAKALSGIQSQLDDIRAALSDAQDAVDADNAIAGVTVELA